MDAITLLNKHINIGALLKYYGFTNIKDDGRYIRCSCKLHGGDNPTAFVANQENGLWYCHTNCGGGDVYTLVQKMEGIDFKSAVQWLAKFFDVDINDLHISKRKPSHVKELQEWLTLMRKNKRKSIKPFHIKEPTIDVKKYRNFHPTTINHFGLKYVERITTKKHNGDDLTLFNRLIFPIIFNKTQIGASLRRIKAKDKPKWFHIPTDMQTGNYLYNYDAVLGKPQVVICEGITDVWAFHEVDIPAVATFGAHVTNEQYKLLLKTGADLIFAFDGDNAGRKATEKAIQMFKYKANISVIPFADGEDPESISREELINRFESRRKV